MSPGENIVHLSVKRSHYYCATLAEQAIQLIYVDVQCNCSDWTGSNIEPQHDERLPKNYHANPAEHLGAFSL